MSEKLIIKTAHKKYQIGIIQLSRIGDIIQTMHAIDQISDQIAPYDLTLIAREQFARHLENILLTYFKEIVYLKNNHHLESDDFIKQTTKEIDSLGLDMLVNLSFDPVSSKILSQSSVSKKIGRRSESVHDVIYDNWSKFFLSSTAQKGFNPFHLIEFFKRIITTVESPIKKIKLENKPLTIGKSTQAIVIHPFSSSQEKTFSLQKWVELLFHLSNRFTNTHQIYVVASVAEESALNEIKNHDLIRSHYQRINFIVNKGPIHDLQNIIHDRTLFIGHDSSLIHYAAFRNSYCIGLYLSYANFIETHPYNLKSFVIIPKESCYPCKQEKPNKNQICKNSHSAQDLAQKIQLIGDMTLGVDGKVTTGIDRGNFVLNNILKTELVGNFISINSIIPLENSYGALTHSYLPISSLFLNDSDISIRSNFRPALNDLKNQHKAVEYAYQAVSLGEKYSSFILRDLNSNQFNLENIQEWASKIDKIESTLEDLVNLYPFLSPVVYFYKISRSEGLFEDLVRLAQNNTALFQEQLLFIKGLYESLSYYNTTPTQEI